MTERITITFNLDGSFRGAASQDFSGQPIPMDAVQLAKFAPGLSLSDQLATATDTLTTLQEKLAGTIAAVKSAYDAKDVDAMIVIAAEFVTPEQEKERAADLAQASELETQAAELRAKYEEVEA